MRCTSGPLASLACAALLSAAAAHAQVVFDGNIVWGNNDNTLPGQYTGAAGAGAPACAPGTTAQSIATTTYLNNRFTDPQFTGALPFVDFQPSSTSPAFHPNANFVSVRLTDPFFDNTCFNGAVGPNPGDRWWTQGTWVSTDTTGGLGRTDLHLPGMPNPRPMRVLDRIVFTQHYSLSPDSNYTLRGFVRVGSGATLTVPAGVVIFGERATLGTLIANRGGKLIMQGTATNPIIATSDDLPGSQVRGGWGGIWMLGKAVCNCANTAAGDSCASEGGGIGYFGGNDDADSSGVLQYVRCEYSGFPISPDNELNSFTFDGVGRRTVADHLCALRGDDDCFEFFGGANNLKYLVGLDGNDDGFDWQMGYRGKAQFIIVRALADGAQTDKGIEADNNEFSFDTTNGPRSNPIIANMTAIGDKRGGPSFPGPLNNGVHFRRGTLGTVVNSIFTNFKKQAFRIEHDATFQAACAGGFPAQSVYCAPAVGVPDEAQSGAEGALFLSAGPNPMRHSLTIGFTLSQAADVNVEVFSTDGQLVERIQSASMPSGTHTVAWRPASGTPAGMYFYRVSAGAVSSQGRVIRIDAN